MKYLKVADQWELKGDNWSPTQWANCFENKDGDNYEEKVKVKSVSQMINHLIDVFKSKQRFKNGQIISSFSNVREYEFLLSSLQEFTKTKYNKAFVSYFFKDITESFLNDYALFLQMRGAKNGNKGAVVHRLKKLRAVCNYADKDKIPGVKLEAFKGVELKMKNKKFIPKNDSIQCHSENRETG